MIISEPPSAPRASGRSSPWVSEMTPTRISRPGMGSESLCRMLGEMRRQQLVDPLRSLLDGQMADAAQDLEARPGFDSAQLSHGELRLAIHEPETSGN